MYPEHLENQKIPPRGGAPFIKKLFWWLLPATLVGGLAWGIYQRLPQTPIKPAERDAKTHAVAVETAAIERGPIELRRAFTGTLEAQAEFVVAPKVSGRVEQLHVDVADRVARGQVVARLDAAEYVQAVAQAEADLKVAQANLGEARSLLELAARELQRSEQLKQRGVGSESQRDTAKAEQLAKQAHVEVTQARISRAQAALETVRIRLGYTRVDADWTGGSDYRVVAERYVDEGETVSANTPLLRIVELDPISAVFFVTERDYARLQTGQSARLATDAYADETFTGAIERIAPVFRENTRQARVEVRVANPELRLKPGMFVRATLILERIEEALVIPEAALVKRAERHGVFVVNGDSVVWREVEPGIRQGERVQVSGAGLSGEVVTLGQQLLDDGSAVILSPIQEISKARH